MYTNLYRQQIIQEHAYRNIHVADGIPLAYWKRTPYNKQLQFHSDILKIFFSNMCLYFCPFDTAGLLDIWGF